MLLIMLAFLVIGAMALMLWAAVLLLWPEVPVRIGRLLRRRTPDAAPPETDPKPGEGYEVWVEHEPGVWRPIWVPGPKKP